MAGLGPFLNDAPVSVQTLRDVSRSLVEIHGQHDDRALVDPTAHRTLLDAFGVLDVKAARVRTAFVSYKAAERAHADETARIGKAQADADYLHHVHEELIKLAPIDGGGRAALGSSRRHAAGREGLG